MTKLFGVLVLLFTYSAAPTAAQSSHGPKKGTLLIAGGGTLGPEIWKRFMDLAGGPDAPIVFIPTADGKIQYEPGSATEKALRAAGFRNITVLHTVNRTEANTKQFIQPLKKARGVWIGGGRQWRLVDSYLDTRTLKQLERVLKRGGVIGGTSAGASIQASYMVRGAREGNEIMMAPGYERGFGFLQNAAVDQHLLTRKREKDMMQVIDKHPALLGIGIDEKTAILVRGNQFEVIGASKVAIYDKDNPPDADGHGWYFLSQGDQFNLRTRKKFNPPTSVSGATSKPLAAAH
jgi:cyanophycinase